MAVVWRQSSRGARQLATPLLPRYVFVHCYLEMYAHLELISIPGAIQLLEDGESQPLVVPDTEIRLLRQLCDGNNVLERAPYPVQGHPMTIVQGRLWGISGVIKDDARTTLLVPLHVLCVSIAVEISQMQVVDGAADEDELPFEPPRRRLIGEQ
jgi:transcription antitermination factor NusG